MKDIDFDELDRAVSSVLEPSDDGVSTPSAVVIETNQPVVEAEKTPEATPEAVATPVAVEPAPAVVEAEAPAAATAKTPLAIKRRGQFMDVVHPSSDMTSKTEDGVAIPPRKVSLEPLNVPDETPTAPMIIAPAEEEPTTTDQPDVTAVSEVPTEPQAPVETAEVTVIDQVMPDPLDVMQAQQAEKDAATSETPSAEGASESSLDMPLVQQAEDEVTPTTPFLADTKVDKRPLDAFSPDDAEAVVEPTAEPVVSSEPLPPELQADVIAVEANPSDHEDATVENEPADTDKKDEVETGFNNSIPQQYASADAKTDDDHSIFDTSEYHQPITPAQTKKRGLPGWLVALLVMFLLAGLSAAGGYFWFYYGL